MNQTTKLIKIQQLPSGDTLNIKAHKFTGNGTKKIYIQANIHGPEMVGILVAKKLIQYIKKHGGNFKELIIVPSCNPIGLNQQFIGQQTGYVNHITGTNWNRIYKNLCAGSEIKNGITMKEFKKILSKNIKIRKISETDTESQLALILQELSFDSDIIIDLHTAWGTAPQYVYSYEDYIENTKKFNIENIILLENENFSGVFDESHLYPYFANKNKIKDFKLPKQVFTLELGSDCTVNDKDVESGFYKLMSYLSSEKIVKNIDQNDIAVKKFDICELNNFIYYNAPKGGLLVWKKNENEHVKKGETICEIHEILSENVINVTATEPCKLIIKFNATAVHQGQKIAKVMISIKQN